MTPKREKFARAVVAGENPSAAYRKAYSTDGMSAKTIANEANKLLNNPDVSRVIQEGTREAMEKSTWNRAAAISKLEQVNEKCFQAVMNTPGLPEKSVLTGFFESLDKLNELCFVSTEVEDARASYKANPARLKRSQDERTKVFEAEMAAIGF